MKSHYFSIKKSVSVFFSFFTLLFCFGFAAEVNATTWYISPSGNDATGNGTMANPWKTLFKATSAVAAAGDIIHVNAGTYTETQKCFLKPGVHIEGEGNTSVIKSTVSSIWTEIINVVSVEGTNGNQHISNLKMDGNNLTTHRAIWVGGRSNVSIYNCTIVDFYETGVIFSGRDNGNPLPPNAFYATGNSFHDNIMNNCALYNGNGSGCLMFGGQTGMLVYNNTITQTQRPSGLNGWPIKYYNEGWTKGCKIYNNNLIKVPYAADGWSFCLEIFNTQGMEIYGNTIQGSVDFNYQADRGTYPYVLWIHDNIIKQPALSNRTEEGIIFEYGVDRCIIENNVFENINQCITAYPRTGTVLKDITIRKNLAKNIGQLNNSDGYFIGGFGGALGNWTMDNWQVYNNTFVATTTANARPNFAMNIGYSGTFGVNNFLCKNNIFQGCAISPMLTNNRAVFTNCQFQYNNFYANGDNINLIPTWASTGLNFPASTVVSNNLTNNPMYANTVNYTLQPSSTLIDAGVNVGLPYAGIAPDRGYAEISLILPIKLIDFTAMENSDKNLLNWKTANEVNSSHFNIERSSNGRDYEVIGRVNASGSSANEVSYSFTDAAPLAGINYYRLAMIDIDNTKEYSNIASVSGKKYQSLSIAAALLSSNRNNVTFTVASTKNQKASLVLFDANGRMLLNETIALQKGLTTLDKNTATISKGIYYLKIFTPDETAVKNIFSAD
jgi:Right handed beta helix region